MRILYSTLFYILIPFILVRLLWRSLKAPDYRKRWPERFGLYKQSVRPNVIWFHAVSVGEAEALLPLVRRFLDEMPTAGLLVTTTTPTGSARVRSVLGNSVQHVYLPYDIPFAVERFLGAFKPKLAVIVETELWPNLFYYCGFRAIPLFIINARLSEKSATGYQKIPTLIRPTLANVKKILAQSQEDSERFLAIGVNKGQISTCGNVKFDITVDKESINAGSILKHSLFKDRFLLLAASTHRGEEDILCRLYQTLKNNIPNLLIIIVPRHPERFSEVEDLCRAQKLTVVRRTSQLSVDLTTDIYLADTMGELKMLYAATDVAFVGGSLVPVGGHNIIEALALGIPVMFGPFMANFKQVAAMSVASDASIPCENPNEVLNTILKIHADEDLRKKLSVNGKAFVDKNRGATDRIYQTLRLELTD
jgi:3-deoxy-D-manno-octulosonic-acid transferase